MMIIFLKKKTEIHGKRCAFVTRTSKYDEKCVYVSCIIAREFETIDAVRLTEMQTTENYVRKTRRITMYDHSVCSIGPSERQKEHNQK